MGWGLIEGFGWGAWCGLMGRAQTTPNQTKTQHNAQPSNIILSLEGGQAVVKIADFRSVGGGVDGLDWIGLD